MAEISINQPFAIDINVIDWDSVLPSVQTQVRIRASATRSTVQLLLTSVWYRCDALDAFTHSLLIGQTASLVDMGGILTIQVTSPAEGLDLIIIHHSNYQNRYQIDSKWVASLDQDSLGTLKAEFKNLPKWW